MGCQLGLRRILWLRVAQATENEWVCVCHQDLRRAVPGAGCHLRLLSSAQGKRWASTQAPEDRAFFGSVRNGRAWHGSCCRSPSSWAAGMKQTGAFVPVVRLRGSGSANKTRRFPPEQHHERSGAQTVNPSAGRRGVCCVSGVSRLWDVGSRARVSSMLSRSSFP